MYLQRAINVSVDIMPIVRCILLARDFSGFQRVIRQELSQTIGWDQVGLQASDPLQSSLLHLLYILLADVSFSD